MSSIIVNDYKIRCYNLQHKITPFKANIHTLEKRAEKIKRKEKCDELTAYKILKKQLETELAEKVGK